MNPVADALAELMSLGVTGDALVAAIRRLETAAYADRITTLQQAVERATEQADEAREARREAARVRKQRQRANVTRDIAGQGVTERDTLSPSPPPQTPPPRPHTRGDIYTPARGPTEFDRFWAVYPRHVGKDAARKAFSKALGRITEDDPLAVILAGVERALPGWDDPNFIPHPASWLNAGRWDDEAPTTERPRNDRPARPDKLAAKQDNLARGWAGADRAAEVLASRRAF